MCVALEDEESIFIDSQESGLGGGGSTLYRNLKEVTPKERPLLERLDEPDAGEDLGDVSHLLQARVEQVEPALRLLLLLHVEWEHVVQVFPARKYNIPFSCVFFLQISTTVNYPV